MATSLLLGDCEIPLAGTATMTETAASGFPLSNLFGGNKSDRFELSSTAAAGDVRFKVDLGSGVTKSSNFVFIGGINTLQFANVGTITLKGNSSDNYGTASTVSTISSVGSLTLHGPAEDDYLNYESSLSTAYRYWWLNYNITGAGSKLPHVKAFFGKAFDPGKDPDQGLEIVRKRSSTARRRAAYTLSLSWKRLTYSKAAEMFDRFGILQRAHPVVLFTTDYHEILYSTKVLFGRITSFSAPPVLTDQNDVSIVFEENV